MRRLILIFGLILSLASITSIESARAQATDVKSVVEAYKQAFASGNLDATFATFADNAASTDPTGVFKNKADFRAATEAFLMQNPGASVSFGDTVYALDTAIHRIAFASDPIRAAGVSRIWLIETLVVFNGKIVSYAAVLDLSDAETAKFAAALSGR